MPRKMKDSGIEWIGEIPESWSVQRGKTLFTQRSEKGNTISLQLLSPTQKYGVIPQSEYEKLSGMKAVKLDVQTDYSTLKTVHKGDYCISLRSFQGGFEYSEYEGVVSPAYQVFYPYVDVDSGYYKYLFKDRAFIDKMNSFTMSLRDGKTIAFSDFANSRIPVPPLSDQHRIASYLDAQCSKIDAVLEQTRNSIEEYKKLKQSVITQAVTKGIRPGRKMKDSGIEWIGEIPSNWDAVPLKRLARIQTGNTPSRSENDTYYSQDSGYFWIKAEDLGSIKPIETTTEYLSEDGIKVGRLFPPNTVYVSCIASIGKVGFCNVAASCNQQINGLMFHNAYWKYGFYVTMAQESEYIANASGNVMKIINADKQSVLMCPLPPLEEQYCIVEYLDSKCAGIDSLIRKKEQLLSEIETYKKSFIFECVTGKREV